MNTLRHNYNIIIASVYFLSDFTSQLDSVPSDQARSSLCGALTSSRAKTPDFIAWRVLACDPLLGDVLGALRPRLARDYRVQKPEHATTTNKASPSSLIFGDRAV